MGAHPTQPKAIRTHLIDAMRTGAYADAAHLPPEQDLAEALGISRTQLRDALACLEQEGFITRRHGVGTIINRHVVDVPVRMDIETEFMDMIRQSGHQPDLAYVRTQEEQADQSLADQLGLAVGDPVLRVTRLCTADGRPAIYCEDVVPRAFVKKDSVPCPNGEPIFHFLQDSCGTSAYMDLTDLRPVVADAALSAIFGVPVGAPLLCMHELDYDINGRPLFFSLQYFADGIFRHTVMRKKL